MGLVEDCTRDRVDLHKIVLCESRLYRLLTFSTLAAGSGRRRIAGYRLRPNAVFAADE
jgi:hypothetical protein